MFAHYGVQLWVPEVGGAVDPGSDAHDLVMSLYGGMSKGERNRIKVRVRSAMAAQAATEGRFLGGRPPYGYRLADAGPHPNPGKAAEGIRSPAAHDPARNRHRAGSGGAWSKGAIRAILANPRYTGRQVWNRQRRGEILIDVDDVALGHETKMRWNDCGDWVWSAEVVHEPLIGVELFERAQGQRTLGAKRATSVRPRRKNTYVLSGLPVRRVRPPNAGRLGARPRLLPLPLPLRARRRAGRHERSVNVREEAILPGLDRWLATVFDPEHVDETCEALAGAHDHTEVDDARTVATKSEDRRLRPSPRALPRRPRGGHRRRSRRTMDRRGPPERLAAERQLADAAPAPTLTKDEIRALVASLHDMVAVLQDADPADKAAIYAEFGISLTYHPDGRVLVESRPPCSHVRVGGGT